MALFRAIELDPLHLLWAPNSMQEVEVGYMQRGLLLHGALVEQSMTRAKDLGLGFRVYVLGFIKFIVWGLGFRV